MKVIKQQYFNLEGAIRRKKNIAVGDFISIRSIPGESQIKKPSLTNKSRRDQSP